jgi:hypothetical protein
MAKKGAALTSWSFTYQETKNNELVPAECILKCFSELNATHYAFQMESGSKTGRLHWQGNVKFKKPISGPDLRAAMKASARQGGEEEWRYYGGGCLTVTPTHNVDTSTIYCLKEHTRVEGSQQYLFPTSTYLGKDLVSYDSMYPWQKSVYNLVVNKEADDRAIHLICDPIGNSGKSTLAKGLAYHHDACVIPLGLTSAQMKSAIVGHGPKSIYLIDLPRNNKSYREIFDTIEEIKRGFVISCFHGKFQQMFMKRPHIVCFTNEWPNLSMLSFDMWRLHVVESNTMHLEHRDTLVELTIQRKSYSAKKNRDKISNSLENS